MNLKPGTYLAVFLLTLASCANADKEKKWGIPLDNLYFDYKISGEEDEEEVTCMLQYKAGGPEGTAFIIPEPGKVEIDGQTLAVDSANFTGIYYEMQKPIHEFSGKHTIVLITPEKTQYKQTFTFTPFSLAEELPESLPKRPFIIHLTGLSAGETRIRIVMTDTAFITNDVNQVVKVKDGELQVDQKMLDQLKNGPINLELYREQVIPVEDRTRAGGKITISYGLKRDLVLE